MDGWASCDRHDPDGRVTTEVGSKVHSNTPPSQPTANMHAEYGLKITNITFLYDNFNKKIEKFLYSFTIEKDI